MDLGTIKKLFAENKIKVISIFIALILVIGGVIYANSNKKIDLTDNITVEFSGYNGSGTLTYNSNDIEELLEKAVLESKGIPEATVKRIINDDELAYIDESEDFSDEMYAKIIEADELLDKVSYGFDKTSSLSNGDKVTFEIKTTDDIPVKATKKTFKVSGLKKVTKTTLKELLKDSPITFSGYNGYGSVVNDEDDKYSVTGSAIHNLSNGDKVKIKLEQSYISELESKGIQIKDSDSSQEIEVSGLKNISDIGNIDDVYTKLEDYVKAQNKDSSSDYSSITYTIEPQKDYIFYSDSSLEDNSSLSIARIYKITKTTTNTEQAFFDKGKTTTEEGYYIYGYNNLEIYNDSLILSNISSKAYHDYSKYEDVDSASSKLKSEDYTEYTKS